LSLENDIKILDNRAFRAWDNDFVWMLDSPRVITGTFTVCKKRYENNLINIFNRFWFNAARRHNRHYHVLYGIEPDNTGKKIHIHFDLMMPDAEYKFLKPVFIKTLCKYIETAWIWGHVLKVERHKGGRSAGYACKKHDGNSTILKMFCPKTGECSKRKKGSRHYCKYHLDPNFKT
jgi:hypothetical protein